MDIYKKVICVVILLALIVPANAFIFDNAKCKLCYLGDIHCIDAEFQATHCCSEKTFESECSQLYKYCSRNLDQMIYRDFTCAPEDTCPTPVDIIHQKMNKTKATEVDWSPSFSTSSNCRISVKADSSLNGRLIVKINKI